MISKGDLVHYDKCGGIFQMSFPFSEPDAEGVAVVISQINCYYDDDGNTVHWAEVLTDNGDIKQIALDYLKPAN